MNSRQPSPRKRPAEQAAAAARAAEVIARKRAADLARRKAELEQQRLNRE